MALQILLADDHQGFRASVRGFLENRGFRVVGEAGDGREAVELAQRLNPDVAIIDRAMPVMDGIQTVRQLARCCPETRLIILTAHREDCYMDEAMKAGVNGYVLKCRAVDDLVTAIDCVSQGGLYIAGS
jgi:DNA-binding NarL/FixJ family response regulator